MKITSVGIMGGIIDPKFGKYGTQELKGMPNYSLPIRFSEYPENTKSFAIIMEDKDAIPVVGFSWTHWTAVNIIKNAILENESKDAKDFIQGANSWSTVFLGDNALTISESSQFGGCAPPDQNHVYDITAYALDTTFDLKQGFYMNELLKVIEGHILDQSTLKATYKN